MYSIRHKEGVRNTIDEGSREIRTAGPITVVINVLRVVRNKMSPSGPRTDSAFAQSPAWDINILRRQQWRKSSARAGEYITA
jgi:hypothetical protein